MADIREISPNNYALFNNGESLTGFHKIERVADNSNYYCLWLTSEYFYLYHIVKKKFALNCNAIADANTFVKIEHYSEKTGTFIAYRKDEDYVHILFEDGYVESTTFSFIGEETNEVRPVKTCSDRWFFYDTKKRKYLFHTGSKGYQIDGCLEKILTHDIFIINKNNRGKQLALYAQGKAPVFSRDSFETIELVKYSTFIGKLYNKNIYCIIKNNNIAYPIGYYTSSPKYVEEHNLFIAAKGESYCLVKGGKEIQNHQWKSDSFIFHSDYVFNKQCNSLTWKIFSIHDGHEIPTNFKNIRITDDKKLHLLAEIEGMDKRISIEEIKDISKSFIKQIQLKKIHKEENTTKAEDDLVNCFIDKDLFLVKENISIVSNNDMEKNSNSHEEAILHENNVLPNEQHSYINILDSRLSSDISYYVLVNSIKIMDNHIISNINCNSFRGKKIVIWLVSKNNTMAITESRRSKIHTILYLKENSLTVNKAFEYKSFWKSGIVYPINICKTIAQLDNNSFELELLYHIFEDKLEFNNMVDNILKPKIQERTKESKQNNSCLNFTKDEETESVSQKLLSDLNIDEKWNIKNIFFKRKFVCTRTSNYICILFDNDTDSIISIKGSIHYYIYGEGKDKRFDHYFGANANSVIRDSIKDSQKRVLLFAYKNENKISFFDEIKCESYSVVPESENKRNVIIFKFRSLLRNKDLDVNSLEETEKDYSMYQNNEIVNEEIDKPSNLINMSK